MDIVQISVAWRPQNLSPRKILNLTQFVENDNPALPGNDWQIQPLRHAAPGLKWRTAIALAPTKKPNSGI